MVRKTIGALVAIAAMVFGSQAQAVQEAGVVESPASGYVEGSVINGGGYVGGGGCGCATAGAASESHFGAFHPNCGRGISQAEAASLWSNYCNEDCSVNTQSGCGGCGSWGGGWDCDCGGGCDSGCGGGRGKGLFSRCHGRKDECAVDCAPCATPCKTGKLRGRFARHECDGCGDDLGCGSTCGCDSGCGLFARKRSGGDCDPCCDGGCKCGGKLRNVFARRKASHDCGCASDPCCGNGQFANVGNGNSYFNYAVGPEYGTGQFSLYSNASSVLSQSNGCSTRYLQTSGCQNCKIKVGNVPGNVPGTYQRAFGNGVNQPHGNGGITGETVPADSPAAVDRSIDGYGT